MQTPKPLDSRPAFEQAFRVEIVQQAGQLVIG